MSPPTPTAIGYKVVATYAHNPSYFTEGLEFIDSETLVESTGLVGESVLVKYKPMANLSEQHVMQQAEMTGGKLFGEGVTHFAGKLWWWSWQTYLGFTYNPATFEKLGNFTYTGEGWGLTHDDTRIISSDGTEFITFRDAQFVAQGKIAVTDQGKPIRNLNELNYLPPNSKFNLHSSSAILANIWQTTKIARADLETGWINGYMDCRQLLQLEQQQSQTGRVDVLNGIATDDQGRLWVTGKWWSHFYVLEPEDAAGTTSTSTLSIRTTTDSTVTTSKVGAAVPLLSGSRMRLVVVFANVMCLLLLYGLHTQ